MSSGPPCEDDDFEHYADSAPVMLWRIDPSFDCDWANKAWFDFTGGTLAQESGFAWVDLIHPEDSDRVVEQFGRAFDARERVTVEFRIRARDGRYHWIVDSGAPCYRDGAFVGFVGGCIDVTGLKDAELRAGALESELASLSRARMASRIGAAMGREVNRPLHAIVSLAAGLERLIRGRTDLPASFVDGVRSISEAAERATEIVRTCEPLISDESLEKTREDISDVLRPAEAMIRMQSAAAGASLEWEIAGGLHAEVGRTALQQVVMTLVTNALEAMEGTARPGLSISAAQWGRMAVISVADRGPGIPNALKEEIVSDLAPGKRGGSALAFHVARLVVADHGGRIWVDDNPGGGSIFRVSIPLCPD
jgi:PAS domain S-box-containing protein